MLNLYASDFEYDLDTVENVSLENRGAGKFYIIFIGLLNIKLVSSQSGPEVGKLPQIYHRFTTDT